MESYNKLKTIFNDEIIKSANIALEKPSNNRTKLLKVFFDLGEVFTGRFYSIKIFDNKYEVVELKNKVDDKNLNWKHKLSLQSLTKKKKQNLKKVLQKE